MKGKICMVTGATAGIGQITAHALAKQGATVIIIGRSREKCAAVTDLIQKATGNASVDYLVADLSSLAQIRHLAETFNKRYSHLDVLVNNAGGFFMQRQLTEDGFERTFGLNHLNYFLLTNLLIETLKASPAARIVSVSSDAHRGAKLDFEDLQNERKFEGFRAYGQSKLANVLFTYELARRLAGTPVTANALHPGFVATQFGKNNGGLVQLGMVFAQMFALKPEEGARTSIYLASSPEVEGVTGKYFTKRRAVQSSPESYDEETARRLWEVSAQMTGLPAAAG